MYNELKEDEIAENVAISNWKNNQYDVNVTGGVFCIFVQLLFRVI